MGRTDYYLKGAWDFYCDICGLKYKSTEARRKWNGTIVCFRCWEPKPASLTPPPIPPERPLPWARSNGPDTSGTSCTAAGSQSVFGYMQFGCFRFGLDLGIR